MKNALNPGLLICELTSQVSGNSIQRATAQLTWVETDPGLGSSLTLYDKSGNKADYITAESDSSGIAFVEFFWDPTQIGYFISSSPRIRVSGFGAVTSEEIVERTWHGNTKLKQNYLTKRVENRIHMCVNLGQAMSSSKGVFQFNEPGSLTIDAANYVRKLLEFRAKIAGEKIPKLDILKVFRPSVELFSLLGAVSILLDPY